MAQRIATRIMNQTADWGTTISEEYGRKTIWSRALVFLALVLCISVSFLLLPVLAGTLAGMAEGAGKEVLAIGFLLVLAFAFKWKSNKRVRNAMQIDHDAGELRFGSEKPGGTFVREQVVNFRDVLDVYVDAESSTEVGLCIQVPGELITLHFYGSSESGMNTLAREIKLAHQQAMAAPIRSRIQSKIHGIEASFRETTRRIKSRVVTRTVS
ncbi:MAG: hypothetical protein AAGF55_04290 [Pseudomonadota bacterium]